MIQNHLNARQPRQEKLEHLVTTEMIVGNRSRGKQRDGLVQITKWLDVERVTGALKQRGIEMRGLEDYDHLR